MYGSPQRRVQDLFFKGHMPVTMALIAINVISWFSAATLHGNDPFTNWLAFLSPAFPERFWTIVTWPLVGAGHPINLLFACLWAWWVCGSLERSWGSNTFALFFAAVSALMALSVAIGTRLLGLPALLMGLWMAVAAPTVAWCAINRREVVNFWGMLPVPAPFVGVLAVVLVWYEVGPPLLGLFALSGCAAAYWYAMNGRYLYQGYARRGRPWDRPASSSRGPSGGPNLHLREFDRESSGGFSPLKWYRDRQQRRKLEKLFKESGMSDPRERGEGEDRR